MLLPSEKLTQTLQIATEGVSSPLKDAATKFGKLFPAQADKFRARCALVFCLQQSGLSGLQERVAAYYLLAYSYDWEVVGGFPFLKFFVEVPLPSTAKVPPARSRRNLFGHSMGHGRAI